MSTTVTVLIVYLGILSALAVWSRRETHTLSGFYLAGKKLPYWVVAFSTNATGESGWLLLGLSGMGYAVGAQAYWVVVGQMIGIGLSWGLVSRKLKKLGDETDSITVPDVLAAKFQDKWHLIRGVAVLIILVMVTTYVTAQMVASGKAFSSFLGMDYKTGVIVGAVFIIGYTFVGGYKAVSYTDVVQGVLMLLGLIAVPAAAIIASGGWGEVKLSLSQQDPALLDMFAFAGKPAWIGIASFVAIGLPFIGVPQLLIRYMSARDDMEIRKARIVSLVVLFIFAAGAVTAGVAGRALYPGLEDPETIFPVISNNLFPPIIAGMLLVVVLSAIMSTVDSLLLLASSSVVRDTYQKIMGSDESDARLASYGKTCDDRDWRHRRCAGYPGATSNLPFRTGIVVGTRVCVRSRDTGYPLLRTYHLGGCAGWHVRGIPGERGLADLVQGRLPRPVRGNPGFLSRTGADLWRELHDQQ